MSPTHPYCGLQVPSDAPFELKPSSGKGWGIFATERISQGDLVLREKPLFIIRKHHGEITEQDIQITFYQLSISQKHQFLRLRDNGRDQFTSMQKAFAENSFHIMHSDDTGSQRNDPPVHGLFMLHSRFNHSCVPNLKIPTTNGEEISSFATRNIVPGEEITFCYNTDFECRTRHERHQALGFVCDCKACLPGTHFQQLSDLRRRLIRGLQYLTLGEDVMRRSSSSPIITDPELREAAEALSIPLTSRFIYTIFTIFLLGEEELLDDFMAERMCPSLYTMLVCFGTESNCKIAGLVMAQETWLQKLSIAFNLYGKGDVADHEISMGLRKSREAS